MIIRTDAPNPVDHPPIPVQARLAAAWTSVMFLCSSVDILNFYKPGGVDGILAGLIWKFEISPAVLTVGLVSVSIPAMLVWLSMTLPARVNRATNLVAASLLLPYSIFDAVGEPWDWAAFYGLSIGLQVPLLAVIPRSAWAWRRTPSNAADGVTAA